jgi:tetratricopeptide (TPR) repeat protein
MLRLAPSFALARYTLALALHKQTKVEEAIQQLNILLKENAGNVACLNLKALSLLYIGDYDRAIACYEELLREDSTIAPCWVGYGHALKTVGRLDKAIAALRKAIELQPDLGEAYWQLADLKTFRFAPADMKAMRREFASSSLTQENRAQLHFALGKALEDAKDYPRSFEEYAKGNAVRRQTVRYVADETTDLVRRSKALLTADFFRTREGVGCSSPDPIFIVGLTRSGSTLIEQILASHPLIEGTQELPTVTFLAARHRERGSVSSHPEIIGALDADDFKQLGEEYIERTRIHRKLGRAFFIDKMPSNFHHLGLLHLMLPKAKIIDARRHPLACGFANFKQYFTHGQTWSYSLDDIGRYYRDYVELMVHFDEALSGRVHRVIYEDMVADPEREVHRLLDYCGVPFDDACLRFYENDRPVLTASAVQVRRPIFKDALEHWRRFEPWLGPLKAALGDVLDAYPAAPRFSAEG